MNSYPTTVNVDYGFTVKEHKKVKEFLERCHLTQYYNIFIEEGFESMQAVMEITEDDLIALNVKRGHRRVIQRGIATLTGIPKTQPLTSISQSIVQSQPNHNSSEYSSSAYTTSSGYGSMNSNVSPSNARQSSENPSNNNNQSLPYFYHHNNYYHQQQQPQSESTSSDNNNKKNHHLLQHILRQSPPSSPGTTASNTLANANISKKSEKDSRNIHHQKERTSFSSNDDEEEDNVIEDEEEDDDDDDAAEMIDDDDDDDETYGNKTTSSSTSPNTLKRKYKRHPKPDKNAPIKPPSAYIMFSNDARTQLKDRNLSFVEIAKIVGDQWKNLDPIQKQSYERTAMKAKDEYINALNRYRQTDKFKEYQKYLTKFKAEQDAINRKIARLRKRAKRDSPGSGSLADNSSNGNNTNNGSTGSNSTDGFNGDNRSSSSSGSTDIYNNHRISSSCSTKKNGKSSSNNSSSTAVNPLGDDENTLEDDDNGDECYSPQQKPPPLLNDSMAKSSFTI